MVREFDDFAAWAGDGEPHGGHNPPLLALLLLGYAANGYEEEDYEDREAARRAAAKENLIRRLVYERRQYRAGIRTMPLFPCSDCCTDVSDSAICCLQCGGRYINRPCPNCNATVIRTRLTAGRISELCEGCKNAKAQLHQEELQRRQQEECRRLEEIAEKRRSVRLRWRKVLLAFLLLAVIAVGYALRERANYKKAMMMVGGTWVGRYPYFPGYRYSEYADYHDVSGELDLTLTFTNISETCVARFISARGIKYSGVWKLIGDERIKCARTPDHRVYLIEVGESHFHAELVDPQRLEVHSVYSCDELDEKRYALTRTSQGGDK